MQENTLQKLDWNDLLLKLASYTQTSQGKSFCLKLLPQFNKEQVEKRWILLEYLTDLVVQGYKAPIGELLPLDDILTASQKNQTLESSQLIAIVKLLNASERVHNFTKQFSSQCEALATVTKKMKSLYKIQKKFSEILDVQGKLRDDASQLLKSIRQKKIKQRKSIEEHLLKLMRKKPWSSYLQEDFFTLRLDRYVLPITLDGRGRLAASIIDTSESGQTLFMEPNELLDQNKVLQDLELSEKLEIIRIFTELSQLVKENSQTISQNYQTLIELDVLFAQSQLAAKISAKSIKLSDEPIIELKQARHPLLVLAEAQIVANDIILEVKKERILIISGPNAGGKTIVLKTLGLLTLMAKSGLLLPVSENSELFLFDKVFVEIGDSQSISDQLSTFSGHVKGLKNILSQASSQDLLLIDEIAMGTEPQTGAALAQAVVEEIAKINCFSLITTHYDLLKNLAFNSTDFKNASMQYSIENLRPTYQMLENIPGGSYGLELAYKMGLANKIIERARTLRGEKISSVDKILLTLHNLSEKNQEKLKKLEELESKKTQEQAYWKQQTSLLKKQRENLKEQVHLQYKISFEKLEQELKLTLKKLQKLEQDLSKKEGLVEEEEINYQGLKTKASQISSSYKKSLAIQKNQIKVRKGTQIKFEELELGKEIYIESLAKKGQITQIGTSPQALIQVQAGPMRVKLTLKDLSIATSVERSKPSSIKKKLINKTKILPPQKKIARESPPSLTTTANTLDLRGKRVEEALSKLENFLDACLIRGESHCLVIHGHGEGHLKIALREYLHTNCHYQLNFRPGDHKEGGDGVTFINFKE